MPLVNGGGRSATASSVDSKDTDDFASADEVKVYKDEGDEENRSENLIEDKLGLVTESEERGQSSDAESKKNYSSEDNASSLLTGIKTESLFADRFPFGYPFIPPYPPFANGASLSSPGKLFGAHPGLGLWDSIGPPPAHMGITPLHLDLKSGLTRHSLYGLHPAAGLYPPELAHLQWGMSAGAPFRPYPPPSPLSWLGAPGLLPGVSHPAVVTPCPPSGTPHDLSPLADTLDTSREQPFFLSRHLESPHSRLNGGLGAGLHHSPYHPSHHQQHHHQQQPQQPKKPAIKKPLNAFMIFMKEMRQSVIEECSLKESAAINQILGRRWHSLDRAEQSKYYEMARREKELHMKMYPGWSARDNYATHTKRKKIKQHSSQHRQPHSSGSNHSTAESSHSFDSSSDHVSSPGAKRYKTHYNNDEMGHDWGSSARSDNGSIDGGGGRGGENNSLLSNGRDHLTNVSLNETLTPSTPSRIAV